ncbi:MAG: Exodeoxyribonuclease 7 small subunit [Ignavibacteriaceae bacterium]|nr:Exodeoxyribonuclease 7 small subunit [Ignavibacteriaceae bacterium]MCK6612670.1 exodeoxyribonuclease VII small subunit [Ignavibacteriaceae bacterium]
MSKKQQDTASFSSKLKRLEYISEALESEEIDINESIALYEEGIILVGECLKVLNEAELKITTLKSKISQLDTGNDEKEEEI